MKQCTFTLTGTTPIAFSAMIQSKKNTGESHEAYEERTWRERAHVKHEYTGDLKDPDAHVVVINPFAIKNMLQDCARFLSESVPGKGKATFTKHFKAGIFIDSPPVLLPRCTRDDITGWTHSVSSTGESGGGKRVTKTFPRFFNWSINGQIFVLDPMLCDKTDKIEEYLVHAGKFIGIGSFRPLNGGTYGRFTVSNFATAEA